MVIKINPSVIAKRVLNFLNEFAIKLKRTPSPIPKAMESTISFMMISAKPFFKC